MFKRLRRCPIIELPELYTDVWRAIIPFLEWPELMGMRLVCVSFSKLRELSIETICKQIREDLMLQSPLHNRENIHLYLRCYRYAGKSHIYVNMVEKEGEEFYRCFQEAGSMRPVPLLKGLDILHTLNIILIMIRRDGNCAHDIFEMAKYTKNIRIIRAARISGFVKMNRPKNWDTFFY